MYTDLLYTDLRVLNTELSPALRSHVKRSLHSALGQFSEYVGRVKVRIAVENDPPGGKDKSCEVSAEFFPSGDTVTQEAVDRDLYTAIDSATERLGRSLRRELDRYREQKSLQNTQQEFPRTLSHGAKVAKLRRREPSEST
jgi:ribosomal subunit interface protein